MSDWQPDQDQSRIFWLQYQHFELPTEYSSWPKNVAFELRACYDVVAAPGWCIASPRQPWSEIWLIREGQVNLAQDEKSATVRSGEVAILTSGRARLTLESAGKPLSLLGFSFDAKLWESLDFVALLDLPLRAELSTQAFEALETTLHNLVRECRDARAMSTLSARGWAQIAFSETLRAIFPDGDSENNKLENNGFEKRWREKIPAALAPDITSTLAFIAAHWNEALDLETLARVSHLSSKHFARKFKTALKIAPMEYVRRLRLERAQSLLASSDEAVGEIAVRCGFPTAAHFSRSFKEFSGSPPLEFRRHIRAFATNVAHAKAKL